MVWGLLTTLGAGLLSVAATWLVLRNAEPLGLVATPNARSSHTRRTPTGGGVGIALAGTLAFGVAAVSDPLRYLTVGLVGLIIAAAGFADDRQALPARVRLAVQVVAVVVTLGLAVPLDGLVAATGLPLPALLVGILAAGAMVYWINLFNFMDGIDGIAAAQALFMAGAAVVLLILRGAGDMPVETWVFLAMAAASVGFLVLNWPPAKIFMGDVGSTYLGFALAALALITIAEGRLGLAQWAILAAAFVVDASVTLVRRLLRGERIAEAHRLHAYQALSRRWGSHRPVTLSFIVINVVWLLPLAWLAATPGWAIGALAVAYLPLIALALMFGSGAPEVPVSRQ